MNPFLLIEVLPQGLFTSCTHFPHCSLFVSWRLLWFFFPTSLKFLLTQTQWRIFTQYMLIYMCAIYSWSCKYSYIVIKLGNRANTISQPFFSMLTNLNSIMFPHPAVGYLSLWHHAPLGRDSILHVMPPCDFSSFRLLPVPLPFWTLTRKWIEPKSQIGLIRIAEGLGKGVLFENRHGWRGLRNTDSPPAATVLESSSAFVKINPR